MKQQTPRLAAEELWVHPTPIVERGGLLVATPTIAQALGDDRMWQVVVFVIQHDADGTVGFILNRPTRLSMGVKLGGQPLEVRSVCKFHTPTIISIVLMRQHQDATC